MNPAVAQGLDPKLKETYDRVMGTELPKAASSPTPPPLASPSAPTPPPVQSQPVEPMPAAHTESQVFVASPTTSSSAFTAKKPRKISPVILIALGVAFFGVYTVVWLKVFGIF